MLPRKAQQGLHLIASFLYTSLWESFPLMNLGTISRVQRFVMCWMCEICNCPAGYQVFFLWQRGTIHIAITQQYAYGMLLRR